MSLGGNRGGEGVIAEIEPAKRTWASPLPVADSEFAFVVFLEFGAVAIKRSLRGQRRRKSIRRKLRAISEVRIPAFSGADKTTRRFRVLDDVAPVVKMKRES